VGGSGSVEGVAVPPGVESDQVECDGGVGVFEVGFCQAAVAGLVQVGDGDCLPDGALDAGAQGVVGVPVFGLLLGAAVGSVQLTV
jgi:hypothetical protein